MFGGRLGRSCYITAVSGLLLVHKGRDSGTHSKLVLVYLLYSCVEDHVGYLIRCNALLNMYKHTSICMHDTKQVEMFLNLTIWIAKCIRSNVTVLLYRINIMFPNLKNFSAWSSPQTCTVANM